MDSQGGDRLVHWCHGAPGYCLLLVQASKVFQSHKFAKQAQQIAEHVIWPRGLLKKGVGLCHGISGNAFALLALANSSMLSSEQREGWTSRVFQFANFAISHLDELERQPDRPYSLYEGLSGLVCLLLALQNHKQHVDQTRFRADHQLPEDGSGLECFPLYEW